jgi:hypothetical protein
MGRHIRGYDIVSDNNLNLNLGRDNKQGEARHDVKQVRHEEEALRDGIDISTREQLYRRVS